MLKIDMKQYKTTMILKGEKMTLYFSKEKEEKTKYPLFKNLKNTHKRVLFESIKFTHKNDYSSKLLHSRC